MPKIFGYSKYKYILASPVQTGVLLAAILRHGEQVSLLSSSDNAGGAASKSYFTFSNHKSDVADCLRCKSQGQCVCVDSRGQRSILQPGTTSAAYNAADPQTRSFNLDADFYH
ncbi:hypothetical protein J6590_000524 [Homalodisca vitripennis]|nr:hypothetical protein J6590_000524 [Homalodisca vitripennis]